MGTRLAPRVADPKPGNRSLFSRACTLLLQHASFQFERPLPTRHLRIIANERWWPRLAVGFNASGVLDLTVQLRCFGFFCPETGPSFSTASR